MISLMFLFGGDIVPLVERGRAGERGGEEKQGLRAEISFES